jgi:hypothetical protein
VVITESCRGNRDEEITMVMIHTLRAAVLLTALVLSACATRPLQDVRPSSPEAATGFDPKQGVFAKQFMAATANPHATQAA